MRLYVRKKPSRLIVLCCTGLFMVIAFAEWRATQPVDINRGYRTGTPSNDLTLLDAALRRNPLARSVTLRYQRTALFYYGIGSKTSGPLVEEAYCYDRLRRTFTLSMNGTVISTCKVPSEEPFRRLGTSGASPGSVWIYCDQPLNPKGARAFHQAVTDDYYKKLQKANPTITRRTDNR